MADPNKKSAKSASAKSIPKEPVEEEYELLPHKEIIELKDELRKLKSLPPEAGKHTEASYDILTKKMNRLIEIFEEAEKSVEVEEGAVTFKERMAPFTDKMSKVLEQNSEIAEGIVALADIMNEIKDKLEVGVIYKAKEAQKVGSRPMHRPAPLPIHEGPRPMGPMPPPTPGKMPLGAMPPMPRTPKPPGMAPPPLPRPGAPLPRPGAAPAPGPMPLPPAKKKGLFGKK